MTAKTAHNRDNEKQKGGRKTEVTRLAKGRQSITRQKKGDALISNFVFSIEASVNRQQLLGSNKTIVTIQRRGPLKRCYNRRVSLNLPAPCPRC